MRKKTKRWSAQVTRHSNALDLEKGVFTKKDPGAIARSLKASAEHSKRRKATPFQSAMSMLNFYVNRMGSGMPRAGGSCSRGPRIGSVSCFTAPSRRASDLVRS